MSPGSTKMIAKFVNHTNNVHPVTNQFCFFKSAYL